MDETAFKNEVTLTLGGKGERYNCGERYETLRNPNSKAIYDAARARSRQQAAANEAERQRGGVSTGFWKLQMDNAMAQLRRRAEMERIRAQAQMRPQLHSECSRVGLPCLYASSIVGDGGPFPFLFGSRPWWR
ncbi:hypothetical protein PG988_007435 [Apiospora saccharicola]